MKYIISERRKSLKLKQKHLAAACECSVQRISDLERHKFYPTPPERRIIADLLHCHPDELIWRPQPTHRPRTEEAQAFLERFRHKGYYRPPRQRSGQSRLATLRNYYSNSMRELEPLTEDPTVTEFVDDGSFDSAIEPLKWLQTIKHEEARPTEFPPVYTGFDLHAIVHAKTRRMVGHLPVPGLVSPRWCATPQVTVLTPRPYTMDALLCTFHEGRRYHFAVEFDGPGKGPPDRSRELALGIPILRFTKDEIVRGVGIGDKLDEYFRKR